MPLIAWFFSWMMIRGHRNSLGNRSLSYLYYFPVKTPKEYDMKSYNFHFRWSWYPPPNHRNHFWGLKKLSKFLPKIILRAYRSSQQNRWWNDGIACPGAEGSEQARPLRPRRCYCPSRGIDFGAWKKTCLPQKMDGIMMAFQSFRMF